MGQSKRLRRGLFEKTLKDGCNLGSCCLALGSQGTVVHAGDQALLHGPGHGLPRIGGDLRLIRMAAQIGAGAGRLAGIAIEKGGKLLAGEVGLEIKAVGNPLFNRH